MGAAVMERMRRALPAQLDFEEEMVVDCFAGAGGASMGIEAGLGRHVDVAINHDKEAVRNHALNHPKTFHYQSDIFEVNPREVCRGRKVGLAWFSPDCTHFSKAKGGKPRSKKIRSLAWVVIQWAAAVRPRVIMLENVEEFATWGPLRADGRPCARRRGQTFAQWKQHLEDLGYAVEYRELVAADYGAPTTRKRLFVIARCDGEVIQWPAQTHGKPGQRGGKRLKAWRTAAECIDWSLPCPSIFERKRPLAENTLRRIARGLKKFVFDNPKPFIVQGGRCEVVGEGAAPVIVGIDNKSSGDGAVYPVADPLRTVTGENRFARVDAFLTRYQGEKRAGEDRSVSVEGPLPTQTTENRFGLVTPFLAQVNHVGDFRGQEVDEPLRTVTAKHGYAVVSPYLVGAGGPSYAGKPKPVDEPVNTLLTENHCAVVAPVIVGVGGRAGQSPPCGADEPLRTSTAKGDRAVAAAHLLKYRGTNTGSKMDEPVPTLTAGGTHIAEVRAFLVKYYGAGTGQECAEPMHTITTKDRMGLVMVEGEEYQIVDIGLRMLQPRELMLAQGFPAWYHLAGTKSVQVRLIGNSVPPPFAEALVRSNYCAPARVTMAGARV